MNKIIQLEVTLIELTWYDSAINFIVKSIKKTGKWN